MDNIFVIPLLMGVAIFSVIKVLQFPYLGIVITAASLPVLDLLPPIPYFTSLIPLVGAVSLGGFILQAAKGYKGYRIFSFYFYFGSIHIWGLIFVWWITISNFEATWFGITRNWFFTYFQLWVMTILTTQLLDTNKKHRIFMWFFSLASMFSAIFTILQGQIGDSIATSLRSAGLTTNANEASRYFIICLVFLGYLRSVADKRFLRHLAFVGMGIAFLGVFFTLSRTGILLLFSTLGLMMLFDSGGKTRLSFIIIFIVGLILIFFMAEGVFNIVGSIIPTVIQGGDTMGLRYAFWRAGFEMWQDNPLLGVGIGQYREVLPHYARGVLSSKFLHQVAHNLYIDVLSETGLIGFFAYLFMLLGALKNFWSVEHSNPLCNTWLIAFLVMLLGGVTMSSQFDKFLWICIGISMHFSKSYDSSIQWNIERDYSKHTVDFYT